MRLDRNKFAVGVCLGCFAGGAEHGWRARSVNIGVQQTGAQALFCEGRGKIDRDGRFSDAALGAGDNENAGNTGNPVCCGRAWLALGNGFV